MKPIPFKENDTVFIPDDDNEYIIQNIGEFGICTLVCGTIKKKVHWSEFISNSGVICVLDMCFRGDLFNDEQISVVNALNNAYYERGREQEKEDRYKSSLWYFVKKLFRHDK